MKMRPRTLPVKISSTEDLRPRHSNCSTSCKPTRRIMPRKPPCGCAPASASSAAKMAAKPSGVTGFSRNSAAPLSRQVLRLSSVASPGQHRHLLAGVGAAQQLEKLYPIHHRHADVQHHHVHAQLGQQRQRLRMILRREDVPPPVRHLREQPWMLVRNPHRRPRTGTLSVCWFRADMARQPALTVACPRRDPPAASERAPARPARPPTAPPRPGRATCARAPARPGARPAGPGPRRRLGADRGPGRTESPGTGSPPACGASRRRKPTSRLPRAREQPRVPPRPG